MYMDYVTLILYDCSACEIIIFFNGAFAVFQITETNISVFLSWKRGHKDNKIK